jgi:hypothetical protein
MNWIVCECIVANLAFFLSNVGDVSRHKSPEIRTTLLAPGYILSPMFSRSGFASRPPSPLPHWLHRFLAPPLATHDVVKAVIAALDRHESRDIYIPFFVNATVVIQLLPTWGRDFFQWVSSARVLLGVSLCKEISWN